MLLTLWLLATPAQASPAWTLVVPFGVPQFAHGKRKRGLLYAGLQAVGLSASTVATVRTYGYASAGNDQLYLTWRMISAGTVAFTAAAWFASSLDGSRLHQLELVQVVLVRLLLQRGKAGLHRVVSGNDWRTGVAQALQLCRRGPAHRRTRFPYRGD